MTFVTAGEAEIVKCATAPNEDGISDAVCELLYRLAGDVPEGEVIVEVGRRNEKSTFWLVKGSEAGKKIKVFSFPMKIDSLEAVDTDLAINLNRVEIQDLLALQHQAAEDTAWRWRENIGLLWINRSLDYEDIKRVMINWQHHLSPNARIAIHGCDQPEIGRIVREITGSLGDFTQERTVDNTMVLMIDRCVHYWVINSDEIGTCRHCGRTRNFKRMRREADAAVVRKRRATVTQNKKNQTSREKR
jgi:hypothetical protein